NDFVEWWSSRDHVMWREIGTDLVNAGYYATVMELVDAVNFALLRIFERKLQQCKEPPFQSVPMLKWNRNQNLIELQVGTEVDDQAPTVGLIKNYVKLGPRL